MRIMTGCAWGEKKKGKLTVKVILRSLNSKHLEIFVRQLPGEKLFIEEEIRKRISNHISRGRIEVYIFSNSFLRKQVYINEDLLKQYISQIKKASKGLKLATDFKLQDFISLPGVISLQEKNISDSDLILASLKEAIAKLIEFKEKGGEVVKKEIKKNVERLKENVKKINALKPKLFFDVKEDIDEEISLITFYIDKLEKEINSQRNHFQGKTLDFLTQEILRELNAASSKTKNIKLSFLIVEMKSYLERIREQVQNIE